MKGGFVVISYAFACCAMEKAAFLEAIVDPEYPDHVRVSRLIQLLCNHGEWVANKTFQERLTYPLLKSCPAPTVAM